MDDWGFMENYDNTSEPETEVLADLSNALRRIRDLIEDCGKEPCDDQSLYDVFYNVIPVIIDEVLPRPIPKSDEVPF